MILTADFHTHTPYSHGKNTVDENAARAKELGLAAVGITDHGFSHVAYGLHRWDVKSYKKECEEAEKKYGVKVLVGIESNIRGESGKCDLKKSDYENFDLYLAGNHVCIYFDKVKDIFAYGWRNIIVTSMFHKKTDKQVQYNTRAYVNAIKNNPLDAITHLNFVCPSNALEVAKAAADYGTYIELNAKKDHLTDDELAEMVQKTDVRFIVSSDAHWVSRIGDTELVEKQLQRIGFPMDRIDNIDGRMPKFRFTEFKKTL